VSYLLRIWREDGMDGAPSTEDLPIWRASIVSTLTGRRRGFASLDDLFDFLRGQGRDQLDDQAGRRQSSPSPGARDATGT
jgi:hypothetical protein